MMKKIISIAMLAAAVVLSSCSKQDDWQSADDAVQVTISTQVPQTRAVADGPTRFILEVYEGGTVSGTATNHIEQETGNFTLALKKGVTYSFLYWADYGTPKDNSNSANSYYNAADLKAVTYIDENLCGQLAYYGTSLNTVVTSGDVGFTVVLKHAVAQLIYENTMAFTSATGNSLQVKYPLTVTFNVATGGNHSIFDSKIIRTFAIADAENVSATVGVIATDYIFAPIIESRLLPIDMVITTGGVAEEGRALTNVPTQVNYTTRIKGAFSNLYDSSFDVSNSVEDMEEQDHNF